jgi:hypothetical protein
MAAELYKLIFADGKIYIGVTVIGARRRYHQHGAAARRGSTQAVCRAWLEQGPPEMEILAIVEDRQRLELERRAIESFGSLSPNGYNTVRAGSGTMLGRTHSPESRNQISKSNKGTTPAINTRTAVADANRRRTGVWTYDRPKGIRHTEETKRKMSISIKAALAARRAKDEE